MVSGEGKRAWTDVGIFLRHHSGCRNVVALWSESGEGPSHYQIDVAVSVCLVMAQSLNAEWCAYANEPFLLLGSVANLQRTAGVGGELCRQVKLSKIDRGRQ